MSPRRGTAALAASPVLVGAVTLLVAIVAVFLSYNANSGLPFVPTYDLKANVPNAAQLVKGFEVRIGGTRVGIVSKITPKRRADGSAYAQLTLQLDKDVEPLPEDTTMLVRPRSTLGLKYLQLTPGRANEGLQAGATIGVRQARPGNVELDEFLNMFDAKARRGSQRTLQGFGDGLAGRGRDVNSAIPAFVALLRDLEPVARNLGSPRTRLGRFFGSLARATGEVAPIAETQASLFVNLDVTFSALAGIARPYLQETISESPPSEEVAIREFPRQRPFLRNSAAFFRELAPGVATLPSAAPLLADAFGAGARVLPRTERLNADTADVFESLRAFSDDPLAEQGIRQLTRLSSSLKPTLRFLTPTQTVCNYATLWFRNVSSLLSEGDANGTFQRFIIIGIPEGPNGEGGPSSRAGQRPDPGQPPPRQLLPEHRRAGPAAGMRGRQRALRDRPDADRQPARQPGHADRRSEGCRRRGGEPVNRLGGRGRLDAFQVGALALVLIAIGTYLAFSKDVPFTKPFEVSAVFENTPPLLKGTAVRIAGVEVGKVSKVEPLGGDSPATKVTIKLKDEALPLHEDATAEGAPADLLRGQQLHRPQPRHRPARDSVDAGHTFGVTQTAAPVQLDQVLGALDGNTRKGLQKLLVGYGDALNGRPLPGEDDDQDPSTRGQTAGQSLNDSLADSAQALRGGAVVNQALLGRDLHDLSKLIGGQQKVFAALSSREAQLQTCWSTGTSPSARWPPSRATCAPPCASCRGC